MLKKYFILLFVSFSFSMNATVYYVDASKPDNSGDGLSWATAKKDLQVVLDNFSTSTSSLNEVWVKAGTYTPTKFIGSSTDPRDMSFWIPGNIKVYGGFMGNETALNQRNIVANPTILNGNSSYHTLLVSNPSSIDNYTIIDGFIIQGGNANGTTVNTTSAGYTFDRSFGGGILCLNTNPTFNNIIIKSNNASFGGGVFVNGGSPQFIGCVLTNNTATQFGGGIENFNNASPSYINCIISNNTCSQKGGGATNNGGTANYINCTIVKNTASGAASGAFHNLNNTISNYKNSIIWGNTSSDFVTEAGSTTNVTYCVTQSTITGTSNLIADPQLANLNDGDGIDDKWFSLDDGFKLNASSNCVNSGDNTAIPSSITLDILNTPRILATIVDRGAYEITAIVVTPSQTNTSNGLNNGSATVTVTGATGVLTYNWLPCGAGSTNTISNLAPGTYYCAVMEGSALVQLVTFNILPSTSSRIYVNIANTNTTQDGRSWNTAYTGLQSALNDVMSNTILKEIWVAKGTYVPTTIIHNQVSSDPRDKSFYLDGTQDVKIYGGFNGNETTLTARDYKNNKTILSGNINNSTDANTWSYHVMSIKNANSLLLHGLIISEGNSNGTGSIFSISRGAGGGLVYNNVNQFGTASTAPFTEFNSILVTNCKGTSIPTILSTRGNIKLLNSVLDNCITNTADSNIIKFAGSYDNFTEVTNCVVSNCAVINGTSNAIGAILFDKVANPTLAFSTIANNDFGVNGNAVVVAGENFAGSVFLNLPPRITTALFNSNIFHNNINNGGILSVAIAGTSPVINAYNNVYTNSNTSGFCVSCTAGSTLNSDPSFVNLASPKGVDNTWFTNDDGYRLSTSSPSLNTGLSTPSPSLGRFTLPTTDIRGANRVIGGNPEPGAYEYDPALGLAENSNSDLFITKIYPNPVTDVLTIQSSEMAEVTNLSIYDLNGKLIKKNLESASVQNQKTNGTNIFEINVSNLASGTYFLKINATTSSTTQKFIKQ